MNLLKIILGLLIIVICTAAGSEALKFNSLFSVAVVTCCIIIVLQLTRIDFTTPLSNPLVEMYTEYTKPVSSTQELITMSNQSQNQTNQNKPDKKATFTFIYADWCGYCKKTKPVWKELAKEVKTIGDYKIIYKMLDAESPENAKWLEMYNVAAYPFIILTINKNKKKVFSGERSISGFKTFLEKHLNPSAQ
jgi:thiol:disulfide interchange protein